MWLWIWLIMKLHCNHREIFLANIFVGGRLLSDWCPQWWLICRQANEGALWMRVKTNHKPSYILAWETYVDYRQAKYETKHVRIIKSKILTEQSCQRPYKNWEVPLTYTCSLSLFFRKENKLVLQNSHKDWVINGTFLNFFLVLTLSKLLLFHSYSPKHS